MAVQGLIIQAPQNDIDKQEMSELENNVSYTDKIVIMTANGQQIQIPFIVSQALIEMVKILSKGDSITLIPMDKELTTQQAADILSDTKNAVDKTNSLIEQTKQGIETTKNVIQTKIDQVNRVADSVDKATQAVGELQKNISNLTSLS